MAKVPDPPPAPLIRTLLPATAGRTALQGDRARLRDGRCLCEGEPGRLVREHRYRRHRIFGETSFEREVVAVDLVPRTEPGDPRTHIVDDAGDIRPEDPPSRATQPAEPGVCRRPAQALPIAEIDRSRSHLHSHLARGGRGDRDVRDAQHITVSVPVVHDRLHANPVRPVFTAVPVFRPVSRSP